MTEVRQFKLTGPLETKELVDLRQTLQVKLALLCLLLFSHHHSCLQCPTPLPKKNSFSSKAYLN